MPENDLTIRIRAIDEATPVIKKIAEEVAQLQVEASPWPIVATFIGVANTVLLCVLIWGGN